MATATTSASPAEPSAWAATFGKRLRYLQASLAEETAADRQALLEEEIRKALQAFPASKRGACLDALAEQFPTWDLATVSVDATQKIVAQTPDEIIAAFVRLAPQLSQAQRDEVKQKLAAAGLIQVASTPIEGEALTDIQTKLKITADDPIDPARLGKLFAVMADLLCTVDQLAWNVWKNAAPKSAIRRDNSLGDLRSQLRRAVTGDPELSAAQVQQQLEATRKLVAGLLAGLGPAGRTYARRYLQRYAPDAIREAVKAEGSGGGLFANAEARCWKKYTDLATEITEASIETDVQDAVVRYAEELIRGGR